jgi:hypothetical protein
VSAGRLTVAGTAGGTVDVEIAALNWILDLAVRREK